MKTLVLRFQHNCVHHSVIHSEVQNLHRTQNKEGRGFHVLRDSPIPSHSEYGGNVLILFFFQMITSLLLHLWVLPKSRLSKKTVRNSKGLFFLPGSLLSLGTTRDRGILNNIIARTKYWLSQKNYPTIQPIKHFFPQITTGPNLYIRYSRSHHPWKDLVFWLQWKGMFHTPYTILNFASLYHL